MLYNFMTHVIVDGEKSEEKVPQKQMDQSQNTLRPAYPKSEPNLQSAFVFPRGGGASTGENKEGGN